MLLKDDLYEAYVIFLTNALLGVKPISKFEGHNFSNEHTMTILMKTLLNDFIQAKVIGSTL